MMLSTLYNISTLLLLNYIENDRAIKSPVKTKNEVVRTNQNELKADDSVMRLYRDILLGYNNEVRPAVMPNAPINVTFVFSLTQIIDVDERNQILTTNSWVRLHWVDYKLVWDPRKYGNVTKLHVPSVKIWKPDIILYNNADAQYTKSVMSTDVIVDYLGHIHWPLSAIFTSSCPLDVKHYPFDRQTCTLKYASWAYDGTKIDLVLESERGDASNYITNTEWSLIGIKAIKNQVIYSCCPEPYPFIDVHVTIERRAMFYVFNLILPCVLISLIALLGFYMPTDSGEKVTLGITSLLSTTVFLMLVAEGMPPTSEALPLIGIYYGVTIMLVALATAMTVLTVNVHHTGKHGYPVSPFLQHLFFRYLSKLFFVKLSPFHSITQHVRFIYEQEHPDECYHSATLHLKRLHQIDLLTSEKMKKSNGTLKDPESVSVAVRPWTTQSGFRNDGLEKIPLTKENNNSVLSISSKPVKKGRIRVHRPKTRNTIDVSFTDSAPEVEAMPIVTPLVNHAREEMTPVRSPDTKLVADAFQKEFLQVMSMVHGIIERNEMRVAEKDRRDAIALEWQQVAMVLDRFLLIVFLIGTTSVTFLILNQRQLFGE